MTLRRIAAAAAACVLLSGQHAAPSAPAAQVEQGRIEGIALPSGVDAFLGVPFAAPPVRDLRWKPPQPPAPWTGTHHADRFAPECLQPLRGSYGLPAPSFNGLSAAALASGELWLGSFQSDRLAVVPLPHPKEAP